MMATNRKYSLPIRLTCGVIGLLGFAAIAFNAIQAGKIEFSLMLFASMFAGFIFLYVAIFGSNPLDNKEGSEDSSE